MAVKNIIFDVGNVLLDWNPGKIIQQAFANTKYAGKFTPQMFRLSDWLAFDQGLITEADVVRIIQERWGLSADQANYLLLTAKKSLTPKQESIELLKKLHQEKLGLYCLTNMSEEFFLYLSKAHDFWPLFKHITVSARVKLLKPDPKIYHYVLDQNNLLAHETVLIDDMKENIDSAIQTGLHGIQFLEIEDCKNKLDFLLKK